MDWISSPALPTRQPIVTKLLNLGKNPHKTTAGLAKCVMFISFLTFKVVSLRTKISFRGMPQSHLLYFLMSLNRCMMKQCLSCLFSTHVKGSWAFFAEQYAQAEKIDWHHCRMTIYASVSPRNQIDPNQLEACQLPHVFLSHAPHVFDFFFSFTFSSQ